jgi:hypothetical protein
VAATTSASVQARVRIGGHGRLILGPVRRNATYTPSDPVVSIVLYVLAIAACGGAGAVIGWAIAASLGLTGTPMALVAAFIGMVAATLLWIVGTAIFMPRK